MKTKLLAIIAVSVFAFTSCSDDDDVNPIGGTEITELNGNITAEDAIVVGTSINLTGPTYVKEGATLTIPAGTTINATTEGTSAFILVERGGKIIAKGTESAPIRFTSTTKRSGSWGGLIINGYAPLSRPTEASASTGQTEISPNILYGGDNAADNSGELDYVILEYTGANINDAAEHNGLTLNGVGNGTKISNIYIKDGADDAIEFFGGSVDVTNLLVVNSEDDMFDFTQGYTGTLTNAYGIWEAAFTTNEGDPRGIEADGNLDGKTMQDVAQSNFKINGMTIVQNSTTAGAAGTMQDVVKIRRGATATITNLLIEIGASGLYTDIIDLTDGDGNVTPGNPASAITYTFNSLNTALPYADSKVKGVGATITKNDTSTGANTSVFSWTGYSF
ncbi:hypothetical protein [Sphingobacterium corticibacterium]|uniref:Multidrug transporter n=1 Tax=Sphingobacterium corticibacterium TaxID=2484746 RepID=A0A4Q6XSR0_9SPHI|nr:hypothetical protein [Sphingobacterium corticibacterium]RZF59326.1 hypothetical protein EWE74_09080 [Sphingobacterium corticibacterium]